MSTSPSDSQKPDWASPHRLHQLAVILMVALTAGLFTYLGQCFHMDQLLESLELKAYDFRLRSGWLNPQKPSPDLMIIAFDEASLNVLSDEYGLWPWPRDVHADFITYLNQEAGAKALVYDLMFVGTRKGQAQEDARLIAAFQKTPNVFLGMSLDHQRGESLQLGKPLTPQTLAALRSLATPMRYPATTPAFLQPETLVFNHVQSLLPGLLTKGRQVGMVNHTVDMDGISRQNPLFYRFQYPEGAQTSELVFPYLALRALLDLKFPNHPPELKLTDRGHLQFPGYDIPLTRNGHFLVRWYPQSYPTIPAWRIVRLIQQEKSGQRLNTADQALKNQLKNKILFLGATAPAAFDIKNTPISPQTPGVLLQASLFDNLYQNRGYLHRASPGLNFALGALLALAAGVITLRLRSAWLILLVQCNLIALYLIASLVVFQKLGLWMNVASPLALLGLSMVLCFVIKYVLRNRDYEKTYALATIDSMTGLANHGAFQEHLRRNIDLSKRFQHPFSLLMMDIDFFKQFNDTYGHQAGDEVLRQVASQLKQHVRNVDLVARYGGEEMAIILDRASQEEAFAIAQKLVTAVAEAPYPIGKGVLTHVTISCGVATYPENGKTPAELIETADQGLYQAKANGRNQVGRLAEVSPADGKTA